jgi:hypothetical protein
MQLRREPLGGLRANGELAGYTDEELLAMNHRANWVKDRLVATP